MFILENNTLRIEIAAKGAELTRIFHKENGIEYLWDAQPEVWGKHSPVLFPIVGTLKENKYIYNGQTYTLSRHGFARDRNFEVSTQKQESIALYLESDAASLEVFPFPFRFAITYAVKDNQLAATYTVENTANSAPLYFSIGAHPAFKVPLEAGLRYEDYFLQFSKKEDAARWPVSKEGLIEQTPQPFLQSTNQLALTKELFAQDALVFKKLQSSSVQLRTQKSKHGLQFDFPHFPFLALWAAPGADFLCIEPWCGIADSVTHNQQLEHKEGIIRLGAKESFTVSWQLSCF